ncbi:MAG TPA: DUF3857 domain-containing protein [Thermoanaerobaculia bacterium]
MRPKILFLLLAALALPLRARELAVRTPPAWVERVAIDTSIAIARENVRWGLYDILRDHQLRVAGRTESHYYRTARKVLSPSGVSNASELELDFDPTYQTLTVHEIALVRNGQRIDALDFDDVRIIDKEDSASERIYDGMRTALIFIKDVRPGDVIDYSWSLDGMNPILDGRFTDELSLSTGVPTRQLRHRLLWESGRRLQWRGAEPTIFTSGGQQTMIWEERDVEALDVDDATPSWFEPWRRVQLSEFASWNEVARWSHAMFQLNAESTAEIAKLAQTIRAQHPTRNAQITAAIRFVQDDIRYLGIEMGRNSHEPHQPHETLAARWGDCKDKTFVLVALLRELGLQAFPALVHSAIGPKLHEKLPSPFVFDHVIAQVVEGGKTYWVDGTISDQGGDLVTLETPDYGRALVIRQETAALTEMKTREHGAVIIEQTYDTKAYDQPATLEVVMTYSGGEADAMRAMLATMSRDDFADERLNDLAKDQPKIESIAPPQIEDDRARNVIVIRERYRIAELWSEGSWSWYPRDLDRHLTRPDTMIRSMPLAFEYPLNITQKVTLNFPEDMDVHETTTTTETPTFRYEYVVDGGGKSVHIRQSLVARQDFVEVKDVADHLTRLNSIWDAIGYRLAPPGAGAAPAEGTFMETVPEKWQWIGGLGFIAAFVGVCVFLAYRGRRHTARATTLVRPRGFRPGEAPAVALAVRGAEEIESHLAGLACSCGSRVHTFPELQRALYDEREMTIATRQCGACGREQSIYFTAA